MKLRVVQWNVGHQARMTPMRDATAEAVASMAPDVLILTEYVDGPDRASFLGAVRAAGLPNMSVTSKRPRQNQVLVATRSPHALGPTAMPRIEDSADVNFIHLELAEPRIGVVGLRAPAYPKSVDRTRYWIHLAEVLCHLPPSIGIIIGDVNTDPFRRTDIGARTLKSLEGHGWTMPDPLGDWSYISKTGTSRSRIDHVLVRDNARLVSATYVDRVGGTVLASAHGGGGISDHAALQVDIEVR